MVINETDIYSNFNAHAGIKKIIKKIVAVIVI